MSDDKVLVYVPQSRMLGPSLASILALEWPGQLDLVFARGDNGGDPYDAMTRKYQAGRQLMLRGDYDYMLTVEDDIMVPHDGLLQLHQLGADVSYGLTVWRNTPHLWSASLEVDGDQVAPYQGKEAKAAWLRCVDVVGVGLFCTLIKRHVLAEVEFERRGAMGCDVYFAADVRDAGFAQMADCAVQCGHLDPDNGRVLWPTPYGHAARPYPGRLTDVKQAV